MLEHHEELAETDALVFTVLTLVFAGLVRRPVCSSSVSRPKGRRSRSRCSSSRVYGAGALVLANTAHNGGRLVHELGVRSLMPSSPLPVSESPESDD